MEKVRLDLFKLHDENDKGQGRIKAELNSRLRTILKNLIKEIKSKRKIKFKAIAKEVDLPYYEFWRCLNKQRIPLIAVIKLLDLWSKITKNNIHRMKTKIQTSIKKLSCGAGNTYKKVNSQNLVSEDLCKIVGAIVADGHLSHRKLKSGMLEYTIVIRDGFKDNLDLFCKWSKNEFGIKLIPRYSKKDHHWYVSFGNKIIFRYLNKIFEIQFGKKSNVVRMPKIIKNNQKLRSAFTTGVLMFDGGVDHRTGYFDLTTKSKFLIVDIKNTLSTFLIEPDYVSDKLDPISGVFKLRIRRKEKLKRLLNFLEPDTTKWLQLNIHMNGMKEIESLDELIEKLKIVYPRVRSGITFEDVIKIVNEMGFVTMKDVQKKLNRQKTVVYEYLKRLEDWKILKSYRKGVYKVWYLNSIKNKRRLNVPKLEMTERLKEIMNDPTHIRNVATSSQ